MKMRALALGLALGLSLAVPAGAQDKPVDLKLSLWVPPAHPLTPALTDWLASIKAASGGSITGTLFPSEQMGKAFDHYDMAMNGIVDFAYVGVGYQAGRFPIGMAGLLPFTIANAKGGSAAYDEWYRKYAATEMKDVHFCLAMVHDPGTFHARKPIVMPEDLRGLKVRPAHSSVGEMVTLLGGTNVQASAPESRDMLERGVADAITFPWGSTMLFGIDKVVKYHADAALYTAGFAWVMNKEKYEALAPAQKKVIDDHCTTEWAVKLASPWADFESAGRDKIKAMPDHVVTTLTPEQLTAWKIAVEPLRKNWAASVRKVGIDPDVAYGELKAALTKYKAAY